MQKELNKVDFISILYNKKDFPTKFTLREAWMKIKKVKQNANIENFICKMKSISEEKSTKKNLPKKSNYEDGILLEYVIGKRGIRYYSFIIPDHEVLTSKDILKKIKQEMCPKDESLHNQGSQIIANDDKNSSNGFITESELSTKIGIPPERIRPFIQILIGLGVIVLEPIKIDLPENNSDNFIDKKSLTDQNVPQYSQIHPENSQIIDNQSQNFNCNLNLDGNDETDFIFPNHFEENLKITSNPPENLLFDLIKTDTENVQFENDSKIENPPNLPPPPIKIPEISPKLSDKRRIKWDPNREMRRRNISYSFAYLNRLRRMRESLIQSISKNVPI